MTGRSFLLKALAALIVVTSLSNVVMLGRKFITLTLAHDEDEFSQYDNVLRQVRTTLEGYGNVRLAGYVTDVPMAEWAPQSVEYFYRTQYGLAPILVRQNPDLDRFVIGSFRLSSNQRRIPEDLVPIKDFGSGVVLFERRR